MSEKTYWTSLWVDSMDRPEWQDRAKEALNLNGVEEIKVEPASGEVRVRYHADTITPMHLHSHLRAAGL